MTFKFCSSAKRVPTWLTHPDLPPCRLVLCGMQSQVTLASVSLPVTVKVSPRLKASSSRGSSCLVFSQSGRKASNNPPRNGFPGDGWSLCWGGNQRTQSETKPLYFYRSQIQIKVRLLELLHTASPRKEVHRLQLQSVILLMTIDSSALLSGACRSKPTQKHLENASH